MRIGSLWTFCNNIKLVTASKKSINSSTRKMSVFTQKKNPMTGKNEWELQHEDYDYHQEIARSAFADMLHDAERNKKYHRALQMAIRKMHDAGKPANVLDIGTGTGLLAIMACRSGADSVTACEAFKPMADCCLKILRRNGVEDKITVIPKRSTEMTVGDKGDMKQKANILVTEVFDTELIGEGAISTFTHAHKYLLEKDCIVIPDKAVIYIQVMESSHLWKWNKLEDLSDEESDFNLKTPQKMINCAGSAAVHDMQLSQIRRHQFIELSEPIPIFKFDWSGKTPLQKRRVIKQQFKAVDPGEAHVVFMWWELYMDTEAQILLSCAPWWCHPMAKVAGEHPQDTIPWRDHWMQGVYYFPKSLELERFKNYNLIACQDEYSLWFYIENMDENHSLDYYRRPVCECGVHMIWSRTHIANLNDNVRNKIFIRQLKKELAATQNPIVLDLNGSSLLGLYAAKLGAKMVYVLEDNCMNMGILTDYMRANDINNVKFITEAQVTADLMKDVSVVTCNPNFSSAILPWENLKYAHLLYEFRKLLQAHTTLMPDRCTFYGIPVQFLDLYKIKMPLGKKEGIDMTPFDHLIESSSGISDAELEAQPLWEYPCFSRGNPQRLLELDFNDLKSTYAFNETFQLAGDCELDLPLAINGFVIFAMWKFGTQRITTGINLWPGVGDRIYWDPYTRQGVKILRHTYIMKTTDEWCYQLAVDLASGQFNINVDLVNKERRTGIPNVDKTPSPQPLR